MEDRTSNVTGSLPFPFPEPTTPLGSGPHLRSLALTKPPWSPTSPLGSGPHLRSLSQSHHGPPQAPLVLALTSGPSHKATMVPHKPPWFWPSPPVPLTKPPWSPTSPLGSGPHLRSLSQSHHGPPQAPLNWSPTSPPELVPHKTP